MCCHGGACVCVCVFFFAGVYQGVCVCVYDICTCSHLVCDSRFVFLKCVYEGSFVLSGP